MSLVRWRQKRAGMDLRFARLAADLFWRWRGLRHCVRVFWIDVFSLFFFTCEGLTVGGVNFLLIRSFREYCRRGATRRDRFFFLLGSFVFPPHPRVCLAAVLFVFVSLPRFVPCKRTSCQLRCHYRMVLCTYVLFIERDRLFLSNGMRSISRVASVVYTYLRYFFRVVHVRPLQPYIVKLAFIVVSCGMGGRLCRSVVGV